MKKIIITLLVAGAGLCWAGQLDYTTEQVNKVIGDDIAQYGAGGYLVSHCTNTCTENVWEPLTNCTFSIPFVSGFEFVTNSTIRYVNGPRWFSLVGNIAVENAESQTMDVEFGAETNGVYVVGSTSGARSLTSGQKGSVSFSIPVYLTSNTTVGLVSKVTVRGGESDIIVNSWQSNISRY